MCIGEIVCPCYICIQRCARRDSCNRSATVYVIISDCARIAIGLSLIYAYSAVSYQCNSRCSLICHLNYSRCNSRVVSSAIDLKVLNSIKTYGICIYVATACKRSKRSSSSHKRRSTAINVIISDCARIHISTSKWYCDAP